MKNYSFIFYPILFVVTTSLLFGQTNHYVSKNGNNSNGISWANAWNDLDEIEWNSIQPGDIIFIDGGTDSMFYDSKITVGKSGNGNQSKITIQRSEENGRNGKVYLKGIYCDYSFITVDGKDRSKFIILGDDWGYIVRTTENANWFEYKNSTLRCTFVTDSGAWGVPMLNHSPHVLIKNCGFEGTNIEDQIRYDGEGTCIIEDSYFIGISNHGDIHEDICQTYTDSMDSLIVRRNLFVASYNDYFMLGNTEFDYVEFSYNVFTASPEHGGDAIKGNSTNTLVVCNNVFDKCRDILGMDNNSQLIRNNIYTGIGPWNGDVHVSSGTQYSLWDVGATFFENGQGNIQLLTGEPLFLDKENLFGFDNIPFTNDDGFTLLEGSPAINNGADIGYSFDIMGNLIVGNPDIGAYEFTSATSVEEEQVVKGFKLYQNYPNPFNPGTKISWQSPVSSWQTLKVYDILGNEVANLIDEFKPVGNYEVDFNAFNLSSGIYFYQLNSGDFKQTKRMILIK
ncbi:MAG: T9SS type A sorting domain-containing protein [Ignavibacteriaceae bacterium]